MTDVPGFDFFPYGMALFDGQLRLQSCNNLFLEMLEFPKAFSKHGTPLLTFLKFLAEAGEYGEQDTDKKIAQRLALAASGEPHTFERERPDGHVLLIQGMPVEDGGLFYTFIDVTSLRRKSQESLKEHRSWERDARNNRLYEVLDVNENFLEDILNSVDHGISYFDRQMNLVFSNQEFLRLLDFPEELGKAGTPFEALVRYNVDRGEYGDVDTQKTISDAVERALRFEEHKFIRQRPNGIYIEVCGKPVKGGFVSTYKDVTEAQQSLSELSESKEVLQSEVEKNLQTLEETHALLKNIMDTIPTGVFWKNRDSQYEGANKRFLQDTGCASEKELVGLADADMPWGDRFAEVFADFDKKLLSGEIPKVTFQEKFTNIDGNDIWVRSTALPMRNVWEEIIGILGIYEDITDEIAQQKTIEKSERKFRALFDQTVQFTALLDRSGKLVKANKTLQQLLDTRKELSMGLPLEELAFWREDPEQKSTVENAIQTAKSGQTAKCNVVFPLDEQVITLDLSIKAIGEDDGDSDFYLVEGRDVSETIRARQKIAQTEQWLRALFDHTPLGVIHWTLDHHVLDCNRAAERIFGYETGSLSGINGSDLLPDEVKPHVDSIFQELLDGTGGNRSENENLTKDGQRITCDWYNTPLYDENRKIIGIASFIDDISDRIQVQRALEESDERYSLALRAVKDGVFDWNIEEDVIFFSEIASTLLGLKRGEGFYDSQEPIELLQGAEQIRFKEMMARHFKGDIPHFDFESKIDSGCSTRWIRVRGLGVADFTGKISRFAGSIGDVSIRKRAEEELAELNESLENKVKQRTAELSASNSKLEKTLNDLKLMQDELVQSEKMASLGGLVSGVAHEVNTPIGVGVTAITSLLKSRDKLEEAISRGTLTKANLNSYLLETKEGNQIILENLTRAAELVRSFKQVAVDQTSTVVREIELSSYVDEILKSLRPKLKKSRAEIDLRPSDTITIETDPGAIAQIVTNLVTNSLTHAWPNNEKGKICIQVSETEDSAIIEYSDDGCGMSKEVRDNIFEPFFTTKRGSGGSGLGMNIVFNLVTRKLGGKIHCNSEVGQGTKFTLVLPGKLSHGDQSPSRRTT